MTLTVNDLGPSLLFCPGDRPERFQKAVDAADHAILDLEDGAAPANRDMARDAVCAYLPQATKPTVVRINLPATARGMADAEAVLAAGAKLIMIPKVESVADIEAIAALGNAILIAIVESARGVEALTDILSHPAVAGITWGPYDLAADMGMRKVRDSDNRLLPPLELARNRLLIAAAAARKGAIDTVTVEVSNPDLMIREAREAADLGFFAKMCIHPKQVQIIRDGFRPTDAEITQARNLIAAGDAAGNGALLYEGEMVDEPILKRARKILQAAQARRSNDGLLVDGRVVHSGEI
ncbi:CitE Citrate lyase beta subunit [Rhabdaerophilaceae bacterium]